MTKKTSHQRGSLDKMLRYALGVQPDEFGIVLDKDGFIQLKELLKALRDEEGFRGVNENKVKELINLESSKDFELNGQLIRLKPELAKLPPAREEEGPLPKELFLSLKEAAWRKVSQNGLAPRPLEDKIHLFVKEEDALKSGKRAGSDHALIRVSARKAESAGKSVFIPYGDNMWLSDFIPKEFLSGPKIRLDEEALEKEDKKEKKDAQAPGAPPGGILTAAPLPSHGKKKGRYSDSPEWKTQMRKDRREKDQNRNKKEK